MRTIRVFSGVGLLLIVLLCSCGKSTEPPEPYTAVLGGSAQGAPMAQPATDTGILADQTAYKSASPTAGGAGAAAGPGGGPSGVATVDVSTAAREMVNNLLNDMQSGEIEFVLGAFNQEHIALLREDDEFLWNTQGAYSYLTRALGDAYGDSSIEQLNTDLRNLVMNSLSIDPIDANTATVTPNPLVALFGLEKAAAALTIGRQGDEWKIQLEQPLSAEDVTAIRAYHGRLKEELYSLGEKLADGSIEGREAVYAAILQVARGSGDAEDAEGDESDQPEVSPEDEDFDPSKLPPPRPVGP
ncbi:MAG: hypothetical protein ABIG44_11495 [Planctomycetota bacterium]